GKGVGRKRAGSLKKFVRGASRWASSGKSEHRTQNVLLVTQVAFALVLAVSSGLMIRTFQNLRNVKPGFADPATIQSVGITLSAVDVAEPHGLAPVQRDNLNPLPGQPHITLAARASDDPRA